MNYYFLAVVNTNSPFWNTDDFMSKLTIAVISSVLTFIVSFVMFVISKKKEPKTEISYDLDVKNNLVEIKDLIKDKVSILYDGKPTEGLNYITLNIENTGSKVVKNQEFRIEFTNADNIMSIYDEKKIEPELKFESLDANRNNEKKFKIGHFEKGELVNLQFLASGKEVAVKIHPFNENGDVGVKSRGLAKIETEKGIIKDFVLVSSLIYFVPMVLGVAGDGGLVGILSGLFILVISPIWFKLLFKFINIITDVFLCKRKESYNIFNNCQKVTIYNGSDNYNSHQ